MPSKRCEFGVLRANCAGGLNQGLQRLLDQWTQDKVHSGFQVNTCLMLRKSAPVPVTVLADNPDGTILVVGHRHTNIVR